MRTIPGAALLSRARPGIVGYSASVLIAIVLFTRFGIGGKLSRDESIYTYAGLRLAHGVPPYASIFDPKSPLASTVAGGAAAFARWFGLDPIDSIRVVYFAFALAAVVLVHALAASLWRSALGGVVAVAVFASFRGFAADALAGPDAKIPGLAFALLALLLVMRRRWLWAGVAASLATLTWQPFGVYVVALLVLAALTPERGSRVRATLSAVLGVAVPLAVTLIWFLVAGALGDLVDATVAFPTKGIERGANDTVPHNVALFATVLRDSYGVVGVALFVGGGLALIALAVRRVVLHPAPRWRVLTDPLVGATLGTFVLIAGYTATDFQGYPDVIPLLPYAALGAGGLAAGAVARASALSSTWSGSVALGAAVAAVLVLTVVSIVDFTRAASNSSLARQRTYACGLNRLLGPDGTVVSLGNPAIFALTGRVSASRFIYLGSGVAPWRIRQLHGDFGAWLEEIESGDPAVIVVNGWYTPLSTVVEHRLRLGHVAAYLGEWEVFVTPETRASAVAAGVQLSTGPTKFAENLNGEPLPSGCGPS